MGDPGQGDWQSAIRLVGDGLLSIVMPAHNLGPTIAENVNRVRRAVPQELPLEIVVVDDGSVDETRAELERITGTVPELRPVFLRQNAGKGWALKQGFEASRGSHILLLDADLDLPPEQTANFFAVMQRETADVVIGSKRHPDSQLNYPWHRHLTSIVYYGLVKLLIGLPIHDTQTGMKLFRREALACAIPRMLVKRFAFDLELLSIIHERGFRIAEAPVRLEFQSRFGCVRPRSVKQVMMDTLAIFYRLRILRYYQTLRDTRIPDPPPLVSVVVAYPAPTAYLDECLAGIRAQGYSPYEIILLPDEPSNTDWGPDTREIPTGRVRPAEKRNVGIREARGTVLAFIDDDASPTERWIEQAVAYFSHDDVAGVGGPATTPRDDPILAKLSGRVLANPLISGQYRCRYTPTRVMEVEDFPSCNLFVRTDAARRIGGFRPDYWPGEDTIFCMEVVKTLGKQIVYDPRVHVYHHRRGLYLPHLRQVGRYALHRGYFARKFPATSRKVSYMLPSLFVLGLVAGGVLALFCPLLRGIYLSAILFYATITFVSCASLQLALWIPTWVGVVLTHLVYGTRFLVGLLSPRMPGEARAFDHPSEEASRGGAESAEEEG